MSKMRGHENNVDRGDYGSENRKKKFKRGYMMDFSGFTRLHPIQSDSNNDAEGQKTPNAQPVYAA